MKPSENPATPVYSTQSCFIRLSTVWVLLPEAQKDQLQSLKRLELQQDGAQESTAITRAGTWTLSAARLEVKVLSPSRWVWVRVQVQVQLPLDWGGGANS